MFRRTKRQFPLRRRLSIAAKAICAVLELGLSANTDDLVEKVQMATCTARVGAIRAAFESVVDPFREYTESRPELTTLHHDTIVHVIDSDLKDRGEKQSKSSVGVKAKMRLPPRSCPIRHYRRLLLCTIFPARGIWRWR